MKHRLAQRLVVAMLGALAGSSAIAQTRPVITMPSVKVSAVDSGGVIGIYRPFDVIATFSKPYCLSTVAPIYSEVTLKEGTLSLVLSHLKSGECATQRTLRVPGLPMGTYNVRVSVTGGDMYAGTHVVEEGSASLKVEMRAGDPSFGVMYTARVDGGEVKPFGTYPVEEAPITLTSMPWNGELLNENVNWIEVGGPPPKSHAFSLFVPTDFERPLPEPFVPIWDIYYPKPYRGIFVTTSRETVDALQAQWYPGVPYRVTGLPGAYVLRSTGGACPLGASPVYRVFQPQVVAHRWTQSMETYTMLVQNGYVGEGIAFCSPSQPYPSLK